MKEEKENKGMIKKPLVYGFLGSFLLLILYFGILTLANSFNHAIEQFISMWYWISLLVIGFGIQVGLYFYIRTEFLMRSMASATTTVAGAGGMSTGSMIACCAHHLTDILPIIGLSAFAIFLVKYQLLFILIGIFSNLVGILMMLGIIQEHKLYNVKNARFFKNIFRHNMKKTRNYAAVFSVVILFSFALVTINSSDEVVSDDRLEKDVKLTSTTIAEPGDRGVSELPTKTNSAGGLTFTITPLNFNFNSKEVRFEIKMDTHQGSLDFDLVEFSTLEDDKGNIYQPLKWNGYSAGVHHKRGTLTFPNIESKTKSMKLIIRNAYGIPERIFFWDLV